MYIQGKPKVLLFKKKNINEDLKETNLSKGEIWNMIILASKV